jgi:pyrimidine operon attenuation protein/uracil phosphoribosyltransferase
MSTHQIMSADEVRRAIVRIGHEIVERQGGTDSLVLVGIEHRGPTLARRIARAIEQRAGATVPVLALDVSPYRDDRAGALDPDAAAVIPTSRPRPDDPARTIVILVDDVLFTGRTIRAALDALMDQGRPSAVRLAVLVDRGHRELPIRADFVGRNIPTARDERIVMRLGEADDGDDEVLLVRSEAQEREAADPV